jgi:hypothetical protein
VGPGPTDTDALNATLTDDVKKVCISLSNALGRLGTLSHIAERRCYIIPDLAAGYAVATSATFPSFEPVHKYTSETARDEQALPVMT